MIRDNIRSRGDFIDKFGKHWDVKVAKSYSLIGRHIFDADKAKIFFRSLEDALDYDISEKFIICISQLEGIIDRKIFYDELKKLSKWQLERIIIVDRMNPANSKTTAKLLKFLGI